MGAADGVGAGAGAGCGAWVGMTGGGATGGWMAGASVAESDESDNAGTLKPAIDDRTEAPLDGSWGLPESTA
jgi:hypothetical protein